jgi:hypothetical protein
MRFLACLLLLSFAAFCQGTPVDCTPGTYTITAAGAQASISNANSGTPCVSWRVTYNSTGFSALSIQLETSPDNSSWTIVTNSICSTSVSPPCMIDGSNPTTSTTNATFAARAYGRYVRLNVTAVTGSGTITARVFGYKGLSAAVGGGGGGGGSPTIASTTDLLQGDGTGSAIASGIGNVTPGVLASLPSSCTAPSFYYATNAAPNSNLYACNVNDGKFYVVSGGGASVGNGIFTVVRTSGTVLTLGSGCSSTAPCQVDFIGVGTCSITASSTATSSAGSDTAYIYLTPACTLTVGHNTGSNLTCSAGCTVVTGITAFPASAVQLATATRTAGVWDTTGVTNVNPGGKPSKIPPASCQPGIGDGLNAIPAGTYLQSTCYNDSGGTWTISEILCFSDNNGTSTCNATNSAATGLLTGAVTATNSFASGTQSATKTLAAGDFVKWTFVADGTSKQLSAVFTIVR